MREEIPRIKFGWQERGEREELNFLEALIYFIVSERTHVFIIVLQFNF